jgi:hypothetical protein
MLQSLPDFVQSYWMYLGAGVAICIGLSFLSEKFFAYLKKGVLLAAALFALAAGYEMFTGKNIFSLPGRVDRKLEQGPAQVETGRRYYKSYEERFGDRPPK